jgi:signal transduction histidine kinase
VIFVFREYAGFSLDDRRILASFADQAAIAVKNAQLYTEVENDRQRIAGLLDSAADGILILTADLKVERANSAFSFILSEQSGNLIGKSHEQVIRFSKPPQGLTLEQAVSSGWPHTPHASLYVEGDLLRTGDQTPIPVGITYAPLISQEGKLLNIITTIRDITRFRQAEELKSTFISVISHELKTPVALIKGYVGTLRRDDARWDRKIVDESLQVIEEEADRLSSYIENLLDASRLQANGFAIKRNDVQLADVIQHVVDRQQTQTKKHKITIDIPEPLPIVVADENRINQVLTNLVANAIKYAPDGNIEVQAFKQAENLIICVCDEGPGIDPNDAPFVFDRFYRSPNATKQTKGAGLGLYLAKAIVEAHGGRIWIDACADKGARVCFSLPIVTNL